MSTQIDDGGPAFPFKCQGDTTAPEVYYGMSLRHYFAGQALAGLMARPDHRRPPVDVDQETYLIEWRSALREDDARLCYEMADAMIAAGKEKQ